MAGSHSVFEYEAVGDILTVTPIRDFAAVRDGDMRDAYNETYRRVSSDSVRHLVFDLQHLTYIDSTFVGIMIRLAKKARAGGGSMVLCGLNDEIRGILRQLMLLENSSVESLWQRAETREVATAWLQSQEEDG